MTTYRIDGLSVYYSTGYTRWPLDTYLKITLPDGQDSFTYTITGQDPDNPFPIVELSGIGFEYADIGGRKFTSTLNSDNPVHHIGQISWGDGNISYFLSYSGGQFDTDYFFQIGGAEIPEFSSVEEAREFFNSMTGSGAISSGPFAPGIEIKMDEISDFTTERDKIIGSDGNDIIRGGFGKDRIYGDDGDDRLFGGQNDDKLGGGNGNDKLFGGDGNDILFGGEGNDVLIGGDGNDILYGNFTDNGQNRLFGGAGNDTLYGGKNSDKLFGGEGNDKMFGGHGKDKLLGGTGNDKLRGGKGNDELFGSWGRDDLKGDDGDDYLDGGGFNDWLEGGKGDDYLLGGGGNDHFLYNSFSGDDTIGDFEDGADKIVISGSTTFADLTIVADRATGANTVISWLGTSVTLDNIAVANIGIDDFVFI